MGKFKLDCRFFSGYKPCSPHKLKGQTCNSCTDYSPEGFRILVIKTGAAGDVIRTTPIVAKLRELYPKAHITWLTRFPDLVPTHIVDRVYLFSWEASLQLQGEKFDLLLALDKEPIEGSLARRIDAKVIKGFLMNDFGKILPVDKDAYGKWLVGVDDFAMRENQRHFVEELFDICGFEFSGETYQMKGVDSYNFGFFSNHPIIGLNTGSGPRWSTRRWPLSKFKELALKLKEQKMNVVLLGGPDEDLQNQELAEQTGALYPGVSSLEHFSSYVKGCDVLVTGVTLALHVALAQRTRTVLLNNIFPKNEFHMYELGEILEADLSCKACYKSQFDKFCQAKNCMSLIESNQVLEAIQRQLLQKKSSQERSKALAEG